MRTLISIIIPTLGRPEKLHRLLLKIKENAGYDNYEVLVGTDEFPPNNIGVPKMVKRLVEQSRGDLVMYLGNDCVPQKDFLQLAVFRMVKEFPKMDGLIGLNDGYWKAGEFATHWLASKKLLPYLGGEFFYTGYFHCGCDNELTERCRQIGKYVWAEEAKIDHDHPVKTGFKSEDLDDVYRLAYQRDRMEHDRNLLHERAKLLEFELHENFVDADGVIEKVNLPSIASFTEMIEKGKNFSFIKIGDGEIYCMSGREGENCDGHPYTRTLGRALKSAYTYLNTLPDTYIPVWIDPIEIESPVKTKGNVVGDIFLHTSISKEKHAFFKTLKMSDRKKIFVGPKRLEKVMDFLDVDEMIEIPSENSFSYKFESDPEDNAIYMFSAGMPSKIWIASLLKKNKNITCIDFGSSFDPIFYGKTRTRQLPMHILYDHYLDLMKRSEKEVDAPHIIPKRIFTIWLSDKREMPAIVEKCIKTHHVKGYEHRMITLKNCYRNKYVNDAIKAKQWGKACDYLRMYYLIEEGGIYLDADVEVLQNKNFDAFLNYSAFAAREKNRFINTAVLGAKKGNLALIEHLKEVEKRFKGDDGLYFESSIEIFTPRIEKTDALILPAEVFYPYDWQHKTVNITDDTVCYHHFMRSWKQEEYGRYN